MSATRTEASDRGATIVQYAMLLALVAGIALAAVQELGAAASDSIGAAAVSLDAEPTDRSGAPPSPAAGPVIPGPASPSPAPTTPTTSAPTTPPTTSAPAPTAPPTVPTTVAPAPTTRAATTGGGTWQAAATSGTHGTWTATATLAVTDDRGAPVVGANATVLVSWVEWSQPGRSWVSQTETVTAVTGPDGQLTLARDFKGGNGNGQVAEATFVLAEVDLPSGLAWTGSQPTVDFVRP